MNQVENCQPLKAKVNLRELLVKKLRNFTTRENIRMVFVSILPCT